MKLIYLISLFFLAWTFFLIFWPTVTSLYSNFFGTIPHTVSAFILWHAWWRKKEKILWLDLICNEYNNMIISIWNCFIEEKIERFVFQNKYTHVCFFPSFVSSVKGSNPLEMSLSVGPSWFKVKHSTLRENSKKVQFGGIYTVWFKDILPSWWNY